MHKVEVSRNELLDRIRANREKHRAIFEDALKGYRAAAIEELDRALQDAKDGRRIQRNLTLIEPVDHTDDYDAVIDMLEMSVDDTVSISNEQFRAYVRDEWSWKGQFLASNSSYTSLV